MTAASDAASSPTTGTDTDTSPGTDSGDTARLTALGVTSNAYETLTSTTVDADTEAMMAMLKARTDVTDPQITEPGVISYFLKDGTSVVLDTRRSFEDTDTVPVVRSSAAQDETRQQALTAKLPTSRNAYLFGELDGAEGTVSDSTINSVAQWFTSRSYQVNRKNFATRDGIHGVRNADVLYISAHGGIGRYLPSSAEDYYTISTNIPVNAEALALFRDEILAGDVVIYGRPELYDPVGSLLGHFSYRLLHYIAITPRFVQKYINLSPGALVFVNGCSMMKPSAETAKMVQAFKDKGAAHILGWDGFVTGNAAAESALYLFDRLLGINGYASYAVTPKNRPFDLSAVYATMQDTARRDPATIKLPGITLIRSLYPLAGSAGLATLQYQQTATADKLFLTPAISGMSLDNVAGTLMLTGGFGEKSATSKVELGGVDMTAQATWLANSITIPNLPVSGPGSSGMVIVSASGTASNEAYVGSWNNVQLTNYHSYDGSPGTGSGAARVITQCNVDMRAAISSFRAAVDGPADANGPSNGDPILTARDCRFTAQGSLVSSSGTTTISVSGDPAIPWFGPAQSAATASAPRYAWTTGVMDPATRTITFSMGHRIRPADGGGVLTTFTPSAGGSGYSYVATLDESASNTVSPMNIDANGNIVAGGAQQTSNYVTWSGAATTQPSSPDTPH